MQDSSGNPHFWSTVRPLGATAQKSYRQDLTVAKVTLTLEKGVYVVFATGATADALVFFRVAPAADISALPAPVSGGSSDVGMFAASDRERIEVAGDDRLHVRVSVDTAVLYLAKVV